MPSQFTATYKPNPTKASKLREVTCKAKPIVVGRDNSQARISLDEAKQLQAQLNVAIRHAEKNLIVTPHGTILEEHEINGFKYFTRQDIAQ